uniref:ARAD1A06886p n=1 Tax=Blastobotrys adeninivorans TaxID=409370 RepID=A0A060SXS3_BLAAD
MEKIQLLRQGNSQKLPMDKFTKEAEQALKEEKYEQTVESADKALSFDATRVRPYYLRTVALVRLKRYEEAVDSAENGLVAAVSGGDSTLVGPLQLRRAIALYSMGRYPDANAALGFAEKDGEDPAKNGERDDLVGTETKRMLPIWRMRIDQKMTGASDQTVSISRIPMDRLPNLYKQSSSSSKPNSAPAASSVAGGHVEKLDETDQDVVEAIKEKEVAKKAVAEKKSDDYDASNVRFDWYQNSNSVNVSLFLKNVPKESANVEFRDHEAIVTCAQPSGGKFEYVLGKFPLPIDVTQSSFRVFSTKIELNLVKKTGDKWNAVTSDVPQESTVSLDDMRKALNEPALPPVNGAKNWDALASQELEQEGESEDPNDFFKQLFANADEDTRRAMMKSYVESNGTALSTDWNSVKTGKVETSPPDGMTAKSWSS